MTAPDVVTEMFAAYRTSLDSLEDKLGSAFSHAVDLLEGMSGTVVVCGMGKSGLVGAKITATLTSTGTPSVFLHPAEAMHGDLGIVRKGDVIILISNSGETSELNTLKAIEDEKEKSALSPETIIKSTYFLCLKLFDKEKFC